MSRELEARKSFYTALQGALTVPGGSGDKVPVSDGKAETKAKLYVVFDAQTAQDNGDMNSRRWNATLNLTVCHKQQDKFTRDIVDDVANQIENIITPGKANVNGLPPLNGWQITSVRLGDVSYADFQISENETICMKFLTFNFTITKI